jgi:hypothetical protein
MTIHYTKNTLEVTAWCGKCQRDTQHRVDGGRRGPCLECIGFKIGRYLFPAQPACFHCEAPFPETAKAESYGLNIVVQCPKCGCMTPFEFKEQLTKAQQKRREEQEHAKKNPRLFE